MKLFLSLTGISNDLKLKGQPSRSPTARIKRPPSIKLILPSSLLSPSGKGTHVGLRAAVERGPSQGARSGSTGPTWVSFPSFLSWGLCEQEGSLPAPSPTHCEHYSESFLAAQHAIVGGRGLFEREGLDHGTNTGQRTEVECVFRIPGGSRWPALNRPASTDELNGRDGNGVGLCSDYQQLATDTKPIDQLRHRFTVRRGGQNDRGAAHLGQFVCRVGLLGVQVTSCA